MDKKWSIVSGMLSIALLGILFAACSKAAETKSSIKVGISADLTGPNGMRGKDNVNAYSLALSEANEAGGVHGRLFEWTVLDDKSDTALATSNAKRLIEAQKVVAIVGSTSSSSSIGLAVAADPSGVPVFGGATGSADAHQYPVFFADRHVETSWEAVVKRAKDKGYKTAAIGVVNIAWGLDAVKYTQKFAEKYGLKVVGTKSWRPDVTDLTIELRALRDLNPDVLIVNTLPGDGAVVARGLAAIGWHPPEMAVAAITKDAGKILGGYDLFKGVEGWTTLDSRRPDVRALGDKFSKRYGFGATDETNVASYELTKVLVEAAKAAKNPDDPASILEAAEKVTGPSLQGKAGTKIHFERGKHYYIDVSSVLWMTYKGNELTYVD